jgi:hypothetical protein
LKFLSKRNVKFDKSPVFTVQIPENGSKPVRGAAFEPFSQNFILKKAQKRNVFKTRSGSGFLAVFSKFYFEKSPKTECFQNPFGERLLSRFLEILF